MIPISIEQFIRKTVKMNPGTDKEELKSSFLDAAERKKGGAVCINCGQPIWAIGSALTGSNMCFSCITGEADDSEDYELDSCINLDNR